MSIFLGTRSLFASFRSTVLLSALALFTLTACTKKNEAGSVKIRMPSSVEGTAINSNSNSQAKSVSAQSEDSDWNLSLNPTAGSQLNCFAVFVSGSGLTSHTCDIETTQAVGGSTTTTIEAVKFGLFAGLVPAGEEISFNEVPTGDRTFHVVGFQTTTRDACRANTLPNVNESTLSEPFVIATQAARINSGSNEPIVIQPKLDAGKKIRTCNFAGSGGSTGGGSGTKLFGNGRDGKIEITSSLSFLTPQQTFNSISGLTHTPTSGGTSSSKMVSATRQILSVDASGKTLTFAAPITISEFEAGDEVLWHVSAGRSSLGSPDDPNLGACGSTLYLGRYGVSKVQATSGTQVTLVDQISATPNLIKNANLSAPSSNPNFCRISLTRVPNFSEIKIPSGKTISIMPTSYDMNNGVGGIIAFRTSKLEINGNLNIEATARGYIGGLTNSSGDSVHGAGSTSQAGGNSSGGGSTNGQPGAGGAGSGEGGAYSMATSGGTPLNYCKEPTLTSISAAGVSGCLTTSEGELRCWGQKGGGSLGEAGTPTSRTTPTRVSGYENYKSVSGSESHTCAISTDKHLYCWGKNIKGQLGDGSTTLRNIPTLIEPATTWKSISAGDESTCGITEAGTLKCWGSNLNFQLGDGTSINRNTPTTIDSGTAYKSVGVGSNHTCGVTAAGMLKCWGNNSLGKLGDGTSTDRSTPTMVTTPSLYTQVSVGNSHTCAITADSTLHCFGHNTYGEVGNGTKGTPVTSVHLAHGAGIVSVSAGYSHTCAIKTDKSLICWGSNLVGQLGDGTNAERLLPTAIDAPRTYSSVSTASNHTCAIEENGAGRCWGENTNGQLGIGERSSGSMSPVKIRNAKVCHPISDGKAFFGGGGGGGANEYGGTGGGLILIFANETTGTGALSIQSNGAPSPTATSTPGGGGGGGVVGVVTRKFNFSGNVSLTAVGGTGGTFSTLGGGGGGGGAIEFKYCAAESIAIPAWTGLDLGGPGGINAGPGARGSVKLSDNSSTCSAN